MNQYWSRRIRDIVPYTPGEQPKDRKFIKLMALSTLLDLGAVASKITAWARGSRASGSPSWSATLEDAKLVAQRSAMRYDRDGDDHFDIASALMKSIIKVLNLIQVEQHTVGRQQRAHLVHYLPYVGQGCGKKESPACGQRRIVVQCQQSSELA